MGQNQGSEDVTQFEVFDVVVDHFIILKLLEVEDSFGPCKVFPNVANFSIRLKITTTKN